MAISLRDYDLTVNEAIALHRLKNAYRASTALDSPDYHDGGRLAFAAWLVAEGRLSDGAPERCAACGRVLHYAPGVVATLLGRGYPAIANPCACGLVTVPAGWPHGDLGSAA